ncbi:hypothetical protein PPACK8108_LOCUS8468 [Phakopsora pachyrhizi]|uniref:Uncharacterized protein n=1 Tax=Phakopsora pachyrhizi TaxID=170000 RepID=A0AAV0AXB1_PHAPC|nr:hypothetical protein PPACK8108_LOCUS8468 [Phakopsora pachyrhizi]
MNQKKSSNSQFLYNVKEDNYNERYRDQYIVEEQERKMLLKSIPQLKEWEYFYPKEGYNHEKWINWIDTLQEETRSPDILINTKLGSLLKGPANLLYINRRKEVGQKPWEFWKSEIRKKYGNSLWKRNMQISFEKDKFNPAFHKPEEWCLKQKERLFAFSPESSEEDIVFKILYQCDGNIEHAVKSRLKEASDYDELVNIMEEVINRTKIGRYARNNKDYTKYKQNNNSYIAPKTKSPTIEKKEYTTNKCPKKNNKNVYFIEGPDSENQENEEIAQDSEKYAQDSEFSEEIEEQYLDHIIDTVEVIFPEEMESSLPQVWENTNPINHISDARLMKSRPEKGKAYMTEKTCMTKAFLDNKEVKCLLVGGAFCSIVGQKYLETFVPDWETRLLPVTSYNFKSCTNDLDPQGVIELDLIFPYTLGSVRLKLEFVTDDRNKRERSRVRRWIEAGDSQMRERMIGVGINKILRDQTEVETDEIVRDDS